MELPWPGNGKLSRAEIILFIIHRKSHLAGFEKNDLDSFVSMGFFAPIGCAISIPKADGVQTWQYVLRHQCAGIMSLG